MGQVTDVITGITTSDMPSLILKIVLAVLVIGCSIWAAIKSNNAKVEKARTDEQASAQTAETQTTQQSTTVNQEIHSDSQRSDDFLNS